MFSRRARIFVSYRRDDVPGDARSIRDRLARQLGRSHIFMDIDSLALGKRFDVGLESALAQSEILLAVIGPRWMRGLSQNIKRGDRDFAREEIAAALRRGIRVIPLLIGRDGHMPVLPERGDLPEDIRDFVLYQQQSLSHETFDRDVDQLIAAIDKITRERDTPLSRVTRIAFAAMAGAATAITGLTLLYGWDLMARSRSKETATAVQPSQSKAPSGPPVIEGNSIDTSGVPVVAYGVDSGSPPSRLPLGAFVVQFGAYSSELTALQEVARLKAKYPDREVYVDPIDKDTDGLHYRVRIRSFVDRGEAQAFCSRYKAATKGECFVPNS